MFLNPWLRCKEHDECVWARELNEHQVLFECGQGRYWYLGDQVLPQVHHVYPPGTIPAHPCPSIRLADLLSNKEIAHAQIDLVVPGTSRDFIKFVKAHL